MKLSDLKYCSRPVEPLVIFSVSVSVCLLMKLNMCYILFCSVHLVIYQMLG